ncbi:hypothetical protein TrLO_g1975 [Triparma laevis f. longispina]|uniref:Uncharacterized protein n=1 Tax=Triparma laevis f. longispina TaxID=1714387 RepID=A0A9W7CA64_9STRA|nr:hypothetical protein TrLO_g1975 [Triparma laevis f. longispina]
MVKHPQTSHGYFEDGKLVSRPGANRDMKGLAQHYENEADVKHPFGFKLARYPKKKLKDDRIKSEFKTDSTRSQVAHGRYAEDLKNAVKVNDLKLVVKIAHKALLECSTRRNWEVGTLSWGNLAAKAFQDVVTKLLFKKNIEQRRPIYYACLCGHPPMVQFFMRVFVVASSRRFSCKAFDTVSSDTDPKRYIRLTFKDWCELLGFWPNVFERLDYEACWISSLNYEIRDMLERESFSLHSAEQHLSSGWFPHWNLANPSQIQKRVGAASQGWHNFCVRAADEVKKSKLKKSKNKAKHRKARTKPAVNSWGLSVDDVVDGREWENGNGMDGDLMPPRPKLARNVSAEIGRLVFQRAVSGELRNEGGGKDDNDDDDDDDDDDDESFELVSVSDDSDYELVEQMDEVEVTGGGLRSWADLAGVGVVGDGGVVEGSLLLSRLTVVKKPQSVGRETSEEDFVDERDMYKGSRGGKAEGFSKSDRHRGKGLRNTKFRKIHSNRAYGFDPKGNKNKW